MADYFQSFLLKLKQTDVPPADAPARALRLAIAQANLLGGDRSELIGPLAFNTLRSFAEQRNCEIGNSCGNACISKDKTCSQEIPDDFLEQLNQLAGLLSDKHQYNSEAIDTQAPPDMSNVPPISNLRPYVTKWQADRGYENSDVLFSIHDVNHALVYAATGMSGADICNKFSDGAYEGTPSLAEEGLVRAFEYSGLGLTPANQQKELEEFLKDMADYAQGIRDTEFAIYKDNEAQIASKMLAVVNEAQANKPDIMQLLKQHNSLMYRADGQRVEMLTDAQKLADVAYAFSK